MHAPPSKRSRFCGPLSSPLSPLHFFLSLSYVPYSLSLSLSKQQKSLKKKYLLSRVRSPLPFPSCSPSLLRPIDEGEDVSGKEAAGTFVGDDEADHQPGQPRPRPCQVGSHPGSEPEGTAEAGAWGVPRSAGGGADDGGRGGGVPEGLRDL